MSEIKDFKQQVDNSIAFINESGENLENKAQKVKEYVNARAITWEELDKIIKEYNPSCSIKKISTKAITAANEPILLIDDDDFQKGKFVRFYPCDEETTQNVSRCVKTSQTYSLIGNQLVIPLINAYDSVGKLLDLNFNFIYRIYDKDDTSFLAFIHKETINSEVINNG